jgi:hypothetical protein
LGAQVHGITKASAAIIARVSERRIGEDCNLAKNNCEQQVWNFPFCWKYDFQNPLLMCRFSFLLKIRFSTFVFFCFVWKTDLFRLTSWTNINFLKWKTYQIDTCFWKHLQVVSTCKWFASVCKYLRPSLTSKKNYWRKVASDLQMVAKYLQMVRILATKNRNLQLLT